ncbi:MAG: hypothetical protein ACFCVG_11590 [Kineosporiaceae bacterium]
MSTPVQVFTVVVLVALPTVMYGGYALLGLATSGAPEDHRIRWFRAGHAHAGVLLVMVLATLAVLDRTDLSTGIVWAVCGLLQFGVLAQSGGMFVHMVRGRPDRRSWGNTLTTVGAVALAAGMLVTAVGLATT